jgi:hypothetical protein
VEDQVGSLIFLSLRCGSGQCWRGPSPAFTGKAHAGVVMNITDMAVNDHSTGDLSSAELAIALD